ncbi:ABC transporter ATP-binding protein [Mycoplasmopsis fermentans]|nr:ABC transporter ATP-binding protein [Mycoplasmopsis fermentans]ADN69168.1 ABC-type multidrug/protein/lipid transport system ATPase component [Mycoplasmopsis fermentans JER]ADV34699.1 ABC transporter, ATP-binding protein [Mycoplasmopsis fermentans M64]VEU63835.1 ABC-type multidrug/protein/lipid transport system ATPase component [Mycoplasmopsis fermentans]VEU67174.1 ABC-type multidrug/protein/lipid transport system ATPase component [Mesomycoplasma conjunctivae]
MFKLIKMLPIKIKLAFLFGSLLVFINIIFTLLLPNIISQFIRLLFVDDYSKVETLSFFNGRWEVRGTCKDLITYLSIAVVCQTILAATLTFTSTLMIVWPAEQSSRFFRNALFNKIQKLSLKNIADLKPESIITRVSNDVAIFWEFLVNGSSILIRGFFLVIGGGVLAILNDPKMSLSVLAVVPVIFVLVLVIGLTTNPLLKKTQKVVEEITKATDENILGARVIKTFNLEETRKKRFSEYNHRWYKVQFKTNMIFAFAVPIFYASINLLIIGIYAFAGHRMYTEVATLDSLVKVNIFIEYLFSISFGLLMTIQFLTSMFRARVSAGRINEILETKIDPLFIKDGKQLTNNFDLEVQNLSFRYYETSPSYSLMNINVKLPYKQTLGIIGPTGSGKSTFINLLLNNYVYDEGSIKIGGQEVKEINTKNLHETVGIVYQEALLYTGTIRSNLLWAKPDATDEEMREALKNACADDFVNKFEDGLDHKVVQGARNLSGGQKQRISIARSLLRKPKILILDDSTSALDNITTRKVINNIKNNYDCSTILISQKIGAIKNADNIMVLTNGAVMDQGKHGHLIKTCDFYQKIYETQLEQ